MKTLWIYLLLVTPVLFPSNKGLAQDGNNLLSVKNVYEVLQNKRYTPGEINALIPDLNWDRVSASNAGKNRSTITLISMMNKEWESLLIEDLNFHSDQKNMIVVTGKVKGRRPTECKYISDRFRHTWTLIDGKITNFKE